MIQIIRDRVVIQTVDVEHADRKLSGGGHVSVTGERRGGHRGDGRKNVRKLRDHVVAEKFDVTIKWF